MLLKYPNEWRIRTPKSTQFVTDIIPDDCVYDFMSMIRQIGTQGELKFFFEHYKKYFCLSNGNPYYPSSSVSWTETDLQSEMFLSAKNPPRFIEAFYNASEFLKRRPEKYYTPEHTDINDLFIKHNLGYSVEPPDLKLKDGVSTVITVDENSESIDTKGQEILHNSLQRSEELLSECKYREAVQEILWLLETITTAFRGLETETKTIEGKYFNQIVKELKNGFQGRPLNRVLEWAVNIHGYLSSPTGGGIRHGLDLKDGIEISMNDARLYCNMIRSILSYLLHEHEVLSKNK